MITRNERNRLSAERWLVSEWMASLTEVLEQKTGERPRLERMGKAGTAAVPGELLWWSQTFSISQERAVWIGTTEEDCRALVRRISPESGLAGDALDEMGNLLADTFSNLGRALSRRSSEEITCGDGARVSSAPGGLPAMAMDVILAETRSLRLYWMVDAEFLGLLQKLLPVDEAEADEPTSPGESAPTPETLALLLELELPVSVSFGRVQIPFQDVLKLSTGSIIELNRSVDDPVEIIVNEQVIASGEVVVVNGNYGVRIKHIASRTERLRSADSVLMARGFEVNAWNEGSAT
jgi:flagellar motor switch protein FliN